MWQLEPGELHTTKNGRDFSRQMVGVSKVQHDDDSWGKIRFSG